MQHEADEVYGVITDLFEPQGNWEERLDSDEHAHSQTKNDDELNCDTSRQNSVSLAEDVVSVVVNNVVHDEPEVVEREERSLLAMKGMPGKKMATLSVEVDLSSLNNDQQGVSTQYTLVHSSELSELRNRVDHQAKRIEQLVSEAQQLKKDRALLDMLRAANAFDFLSTLGQTDLQLKETNLRLAEKVRSLEQQLECAKKETEVGAGGQRSCDVHNHVGTHDIQMSELENRVRYLTDELAKMAAKRARAQEKITQLTQAQKADSSLTLAKFEAIELKDKLKSQEESIAKLNAAKSQALKNENTWNAILGTLTSRRKQFPHVQWTIIVVDDTDINYLSYLPEAHVNKRFTFNGTRIQIVYFVKP
ncbi:hypothetical protein HDE_14369 [Halotydeus destructor]|nr:hypothetical protein HDE_14369 [Halotydeus destructor]